MDDLPIDHFTITGAYTPHVYRDQYPSIDPTSPALSQQGKVVIITGASRGIGALGFAPAFAKAGAKAIVLVARSTRELADTEANVRKISPTTDVLLFPASISDETAVAKLYEMIAQKYGHAEVLVNNAGLMNTQSFAAVGDLDADAWWGDFEVNIKGTMLMTRGFLKLLGKAMKGTVITMNSGAATSVQPMLSAYGISKLASLRFMEYVAAEYGNVSAVSLQPGIVKTDAVIGELILPQIMGYIYLTI